MYYFINYANLIYIQKNPKHQKKYKTKNQDMLPREKN